MINFKVTTTSENSKEGTFVFEPLQAGFGHTMGNILRRVLISSLEGAAITAVKIDGVSHQFSTITGISEDVIEIILSLKKVRIKLFSDKPVKMILKASGKGEVTAKQIDTKGNGEIVNPDQHVASLNDAKAKLEIELTVEKGMGYVSVDESKGDEIGLLSIDAIFSPVLSVNYSVDPTRVGRKTNFDKLTLNIKTDGTMKPEDALMQASKLMAAYFKQIYSPTFDPIVVVEESSLGDDVLKMSVEELDLPVRITNALKAIDINTVENLITTQRQTLMKAKNLGAKSLSLISEKLTERGLSLSEA